MADDKCVCIDYLANWCFVENSWWVPLDSETNVNGICDWPTVFYWKQNVGFAWFRNKCEGNIWLTDGFLLETACEFHLIPRQEWMKCLADWWFSVGNSLWALLDSETDVKSMWLTSGFLLETACEFRLIPKQEWMRYLADWWFPVGNRLWVIVSETRSKGMWLTNELLLEIACESC